MVVIQTIATTTSTTSTMKLIRKSSSNVSRRSAALVTIASYCFSSAKGAFHTTTTSTTSLNHHHRNSRAFFDFGHTGVIHHPYYSSTFMPIIRTTSNTLSSVRSSSISSTSKHNHNDGLMPDMLQRIRACNQIPTNVKFLDFVVKDQIVGKVTLDMALRFSQSPIFELEENGKEKKALTLTSKAGFTVESRTKSIMKVMKELKEEGIIQGWRDELYSVSTSFYDTKKGEEPFFLMERAAVWTLGILQYGVHINGLVSCQNNNNNNNMNKEPKMWIARRSKTKSKYPGMLDHIVAGGQPFGLSLMENVIKECFEEAGVPEELVRQNLRSAGVISYESYHHVINENNNITQHYGGLERVVLFNYDLYLPPDFKPKVVDGEVDEFMLWDLGE